MKEQHQELILEMHDIVKEFSGVRVLDNVNFELKRGTVHALMGENGAGKSTLMKILCGIYSKTSGAIQIGGKSVEINSPSDSKALGIAMIHQELSAFRALTVSANMFMNREFMRGWLIDEAKMNEETEKVLKELNININPKTYMERLSVAEMQLVEIAKAVSTDADIIIMDEPTSALTEAEVSNLYKTVADLKSRGKSIIYISHKVEEIFVIADEVTVLRDGNYVGHDFIDNLDRDKLISMMVGRTLSQRFHKTVHEFGDVVLKVENLCRKGKFEDISFEVRAGEVLGFAGLIGAGRTDVVETIFGLTEKDCGIVYMNGEVINIDSPRDAIDHQIGFVSEDRKNIGLNLVGSVKENITLANLQKYCKLGIINSSAEIIACDDFSKRLSIKANSRDTLTMNLSGGNQQKVILARWMSIEPKILILDEPTKGIDVGAKSEIYKLIDKFALAGNSVIMVSSEMMEILGMSDRIIVMHEGEMIATFDRNEATQEKILAAAAGL
jgi:inositol transport system ATP-binding protein